MKKQNKDKNLGKISRCALGFTLAELLMVVVILGILSAIALPQFAPQKEKAYVAEAVGILGSIRQLEEAYRLENGTYCDPNPTPAGTACTSGWPSLGMTASPNNTFWVYTFTTASTTAFTAVATRQSARWSGAAAYSSSSPPTVILDNTGVYTGTHPNKPV